MLQDYLEVIQEFKHASVSLIEGECPTLLVTATNTYIPNDQFKTIFNETGIIVKNFGIKKLIFDKSELRVFHQPSMIWYFVEWKEKMFDLGLKKHVKILPKDEVFRQSVKIGRNKIDQTYPDGKFHKMEILYAESLEEAFHL